MDIRILHDGPTKSIQSLCFVLGFLGMFGSGEFAQNPAIGQTLTFPSSQEKLHSGETSELIQFKQPFIFDVQYATDGTELAVIFRKVAPLLLDTKTWTRQRELPGMHQLAFSPNMKLFATAEGNGGLRIWDRQSDAISTSYLGRGQSDVTRQCTFGAAGKWLASAHDDGTVRVWDVDSKQAIAELQGHSEAAMSVQFSNDGKRLYSCGKDNTIRIWDTQTWGVEKVIKGPPDNQIVDLAISDDDSRLASVHSKVGVMIWNTERWVASMHARFRCVASLKDENLFALGGPGMILLTDGSRSSERRINVVDPQKRLSAGDVISAIACSPDGKHLAAANDLGDLRIIQID